MGDVAALQQVAHLLIWIKPQKNKTLPQSPKPNRSHFQLNATKRGHSRCLRTGRHVRFWPMADVGGVHCGCPLMTHIGHWTSVQLHWSAAFNRIPL